MTTKSSAIKAFFEGNLRGVFFLFAIVLLAEALLQWKIYVLLWENSHVMSGLIETRWFYVSNNRYGMFATQLLPVAAAQAGAPAMTLLGLQALNYALLPMVVMALTAFWLKDVSHTVLIFFFTAFGGLYIHFAKEYSLVPTLWYCLLLSAYLRSERATGSLPSMLFIGFLALLIIFSHSLAVFFMGLVFIGLWGRIDRRLILITGSVMVIGLVLSILQSDYIAGNVSSVEREINEYGVAMTLFALRHLLFYFSTIFLLGLTAYMAYTRRMDRRLGIIWLAAAGMTFIALRYVISVAGTPYGFDVHFLINTRTEVTLFYIVTGLVYVSLMRLEWRGGLIAFLVVLSIGRFIWLNALSSEWNEHIARKEQLVERLLNTYPDQQIFIVDRDCPDIPVGYQHDDFKHESSVISWFYDRPAIVYLSDDLTIREYQGRPFFVNTTKKEVNLEDPDTYVFPFDPLAEFTRWNLDPERITLVGCPDI